jgi:hypothetical protein
MCREAVVLFASEVASNVMRHATPPTRYEACLAVDHRVSIQVVDAARESTESVTQRAVRLVSEADVPIVTVEERLNVAVHLGWVDDDVEKFPRVDSVAVAADRVLVA